MRLRRISSRAACAFFIAPQNSASFFQRGLSKLPSEIETRIVENKKLLTASPFLDMLYQLQSTSENFSDNLSVLDRELAERAASLEKAHAWLHQFNEILACNTPIGKSTVANRPGIVKEPSPQVYVASFTANAVTFQLRAWTDQHQAWAQLRSDLSLAVKDALAREKIAIT
jgi:small-conductance mechanosensitive channel